MRLADIMDTQAVTVYEETELEEIVTMMSGNKAGDFPVVNNDYDFQGMVYAPDLLKVLYPGTDMKNLENLTKLEDLAGFQAGIRKVTAGKLMTRAVKTFSVDDTVVRTGAVLLFENIRVAPVLQGRRLAGTITQSRVFEQLMRKFENESLKKKLRPEDSPKISQAGGSADRRFFPRVPLRIPLAYKIIKNPQGRAVAGEGKIGKTLDVSAGGLRVLLEEELPLHALLQVALDFYRNEQPVRMICRVVRCMPAKEAGFFKTGLMYLTISPDERRRMNRYLQEILPSEDSD